MRVLMILLAGVALGAESPEQATIRIESGSNVRALNLKIDSGGLRCTAEGIPSHHIKVGGLDGLSAPFSHERDPGKCTQVLTWRNAGKSTTTCYHFGKNKVLDEVLRWCASL